MQWNPINDLHAVGRAPHVLVLHLAQAMLSADATATLRCELVNVGLQDGL